MLCEEIVTCMPVCCWLCSREGILMLHLLINLH